MKFHPVFKEKIWGGDKIKTRLGLNFSPLPNCGEAWALSGVPECQTLVLDGFLQGNELNEIVEIYMEDLVGEKVYERYGNEFPLLIKFIDAQDYLSIQVHPDDELAAKRCIGRGKTEMWYILDADPGAELIRGFTHTLTPEIYLQHLGRKRLRDILNVEHVKKGDSFFIPAGLVHALGPGILLAEIQQTSDTTYRIYDWDRVDENGHSRELHTELALDAINFKVDEQHKPFFGPVRSTETNLATSPYFTTNLLHIDKPHEINKEELDSFVILIGVEGSTLIRSDDHRLELRMGEVALIPAMAENLILIPDRRSQLLEVHID